MTELEILKIDLENLIQGMSICREDLTHSELDCLELLKRCNSVINRIKPCGKEK